VNSPLSHLLMDFKNLRQAQIRRSYADSWNTTARVFTSCIPPLNQNEEPNSSYLYWETGLPNSRILDGSRQWQMREEELRTQIEQEAGNHRASVFNLPRFHKLEQLNSLVPCEDMVWLMDKFEKDVCAIFGIPREMIQGKLTGNETSSRADITSRMFSFTVQTVCKMLEELIATVYSDIYGTEKSDIKISFCPMPRVDVNSLEDVKILYEIGALTPDVVAQLSEILLINDRTGITGKKRKTTHPPSVYKNPSDPKNQIPKPPAKP
jgi:hypothetical protein